MYTSNIFFIWEDEDLNITKFPRLLKLRALKIYHFNHLNVFLLVSHYQLSIFLLLSLSVFFSLTPFRVSASNMDQAPYSKPSNGFLLYLRTHANTFTRTPREGPGTTSLISALIPLRPTHSASATMTLLSLDCPNSLLPEGL